jgi:multimeric flavodoxin WrbA
MRILGIVGGVRREGNTTKLVEAVLDGARQAGNETKLVKLVELNFDHMHEKDGKWVFPDDEMAKLYSFIEGMGGFVLGAPIYFGQVDSRTMKFIERLYYWSQSHGEEYAAKFPKNVKAVNCITFGQPDPAAYNKVLDWLVGIEKGRGMVNHGNIVAEATRSKPVTSRTDLIEKAYILGKSF